MATLAIVLDMRPPYSTLPAPFRGLGAIVPGYNWAIPAQSIAEHTPAPTIGATLTCDDGLARY